MADDEGAAYWESVYGQPVHQYARDRDKLDGMTDDEYAAYVRRRMWERTHAGLLEDREQRRRQRERQRERDTAAAEEADRIRREMEASLRRGDERRRRRRGRDAWEAYRARCAAWDAAASPTPDRIPWPVLSLTPSSQQEDEGDRGGEALRTLFVDGLGRAELGDVEFAARLKEERVRWHPDKMQQRFGQHIEAQTMKLVTAVFQVIDRLWNERNLRSK